MNANELMIGNYVLDPYGKEIRLTSVEQDASMLTPIPITEDWLLRFGFDKIDYNFYNKEGYPCDIEYCLKCDGFILEYQSDFSISIFGVETDLGVTPDIHLFRYIHQLQNLYFLLQGQELTIK